MNAKASKSGLLREEKDSIFRLLSNSVSAPRLPPQRWRAGVAARDVLANKLSTSRVGLITSAKKPADKLRLQVQE
ncbi:MAG: hypothetical protein A3C56_03170 [Ignavibacteria bacterium RIFCSPHIGHO2_02_FULL_56_12]|nr:MAG: hypothetical protein A3C56_03170 [Ignavibacteria bacterium RIFCSPHIGHO2_02_FULL_56_12]